jgi:sugar phosphate isomerase/epimerase
MDIGISTLVDLDQPIDRLLELIAEAGFTHVSLSHDIEHAGYYTPTRRDQLRNRLAALGLKLSYVHAPIQYYYDLTSLDRHLRRASIELMKVALAACAELEGRSVVLHIMNGPLDPGESVEERRQAGVDSAADLIMFAQRLGVEVHFETLPLNIDCGVVSLAVLRSTELAGKNVCLDTCHARISQPGMIELVRELAPRVASTHISDTRGEEDSHLIPGDGVVDFVAVARELGQAGFNGVVDLECSLWMLRRRLASGHLHPGDPPACDIPWITTPQYLKWCAAAARRLALLIESAAPESSEPVGRTAAPRTR